MTSAIALFGAFERYNVRWNGDIDNPWWVAADVCSALGLTNVSMAVNGNPITGDLGLDDDEKDNIRIPDTIGRSRKTIIVNEAGLYRLIFKSRKAEAKTFQRWVFHEVLPSIRKYGCYPPWANGERLSPEEQADYEAALAELYERLTLKLGEPFGGEHISVWAAILHRKREGCEEPFDAAAIVAYLAEPEPEMDNPGLHMEVAAVARCIGQLRRWGWVTEERLLPRASLHVLEGGADD
ncbi:BRO-N domain-containing protein [Stenomitos frigidus]|uniref:Bro-N domain-containing protein n=1 Tax=Stenomitos frigidus ULC18 TaxID=2107698 RepID=A0A2T1EB22_9CYAN|nr:BRO family protein [Stenomitos frigidus]PSB29920.1 hypothetical protein C7B82_10225 [Stenomitos frigidus ULC18]